jgi:hypothetical protein
MLGYLVPGRGSVALPNRRRQRPSYARRVVFLRIATLAVMALLFSACNRSSHHGPTSPGATATNTRPAGSQSIAAVPLPPESTVEEPIVTPWRPGGTASPTFTTTPRPTTTPTPSPTPTLEAVATASPTGGTPSGDQDYAVYSAVLKSEFTMPRQKRLVALDTTVAPPLSDARAAEVATWAEPDLVTAFRDQNQTSVPLAHKLELPMSYTLLSRSSVKGLVDEPSWAKFNQQYPTANGYLELSRVGFDATGDHALVYVAQHDGPSTGRGALFLLEKHGDQWQVAGGDTLWVQ